MNNRYVTNIFYANNSFCIEYSDSSTEYRDVPAITNSYDGSLKIRIPGDSTEHKIKTDNFERQFKKAPIDLDILKNRYNNTCFKCKNYTSIFLAYTYQNVTRYICNDCGAESFDKLFDLDISAKSQKILYSKD